MLEGEKYEIYDAKGRKRGEIGRKSEFDGGCCIGLIIIVAAAVLIVAWAYAIMAAIEGNLLMKLATSLTIVFAIIAGGKIKTKKNLDTFWKKAGITTVTSGAGAGIIMMIITLLEGSSSEVGALLWIPCMILFALVPSLIVTILESPASKK
ncbi:MAG: hypothetical protein IJZ39_06315 [Oscillospiraceae bacterium]|nr:hypothetical protein [Oscillospiraceae bacterium]